MIFGASHGQIVETIATDTERDNFMGPTEAKEYGLIDELIESERMTPAAINSSIFRRMLDKLK